MGKGFLLLEMGHCDEAKQLLRDHLRISQTAKLRFALARVERECLLQERTRLNNGNEAEICKNWRLIGTLNSAFKPVSQLGEGRTWLFEKGDQQAGRNTLKSFNKMREWMKPFITPIAKGKPPASN